MTDDDIVDLAKDFSIEGEIIGFARAIAAKEREACASLIAAASDLLEALELADCVLRGRNMDLRVVAHKVDAALKKARG